MSKTNKTVRELRDDELEKVSGGYIFTDVMVESIAIAQRWSFGATQTGSFAGDGLGSAHAYNLLRQNGF